MYEKRQGKTLRRLLTFLLALCLTRTAWASERSVIPLGRAVGIKLFAEGALVVSVEDGQSADILRPGDVLLTMNGQSIESAEALQALLAENEDAPAELTCRRDGKIFTCTVTPSRGDDGVWRMGAWVRDSMAGVGTLTYYDPATGLYGALGHGITDVDTQTLMTLSGGSIMDTAVKAVKRGSRGDPGELKGDFSTQRDVGSLTANTVGGIFGQVEDTSLVTGNPVPIASADQITTGPATILSTVSGQETKAYQVEILRLFGGDATRNMLLRVTDQSLLRATGGIVQGMSGSPILQNGRLVGALTHVLVNDPTQGYGIFIENMMALSD